MASSVPHRTYTIQEFVQLEEYSNVRHEFLEGQIYAMAGGTPEHGAYAANIIGLLTAQLRDRPCRVYTSDVRIRIQATGLDTYPDVSVVCGRAETDRDDKDALVNPTLLVEILSPGTADYDRGEKLEHYKKIPALREVVLVAQHERCIEVVRRGVDGSWTVLTAGAGEAAHVESLGCTLAVDDVYRDPLGG